MKAIVSASPIDYPWNRNPPFAFLGKGVQASFNWIGDFMKVGAINVGIQRVFRHGGECLVVADSTYSRQRTERRQPV
ncbi:hypothetical protein GmRootV213_56410 (plasmid) [Variovorax sp. V213]|uniref:hypothetical protein n=1 Tax=Variovorax sp. V213 TaxID=3065955 RepID=UPI0034E86438